MKNLLFIPALALALTAVPATAQQNKDKGKLKTSTDSISYVIGYDIGKNLKSQSVETNLDALARGISDAIAEKTSSINEEDARNLMMALQQQLMARQAEVAAKQGGKNKEEGDAFLKKNSQRQGVVTLPSGLQYEVITAGTGPTPTVDDEVTTHYKGTLLDGTTFDSSYDRGQPASFPVSGVIKGWTEALQLMKVGSKWRLYVPSDLAYGANGAGQTIGPNATLIFDVELLSIKGK